MKPEIAVSSALDHLQMIKIVINSSYGGFRLSDDAYEKLIEYGIPLKKDDGQNDDQEHGIYHVSNDYRHMIGHYWDNFLQQNRSHPLLVRVVEELGAKASGPHAVLKVVEIPDGVEWMICEYDGREWIAEKHRTWS